MMLHQGTVIIITAAGLINKNCNTADQAKK
jgi:hypothetical protein